MTYIVIAVCLLLTVGYSIQGDVQNSTQSTDVTGKQNSTNSASTETTPAAKLIGSNSSHNNSAVHDVIQKTNITTNGTKAGSGNETQTEDPVIINGSTFPLPGTQITGGSNPSTRSTETPTVTTPTTSKSSTPSPSTSSTTAVPTDHSSIAPTIKPTPTLEPITPSPTHHRGFDGPSFVGGIVLALGLVAIGFVAFKFYKARTELNYHTL